MFENQTLHNCEMTLSPNSRQVFPRELDFEVDGFLKLSYGKFDDSQSESFSPVHSKRSIDFENSMSIFNLQNSQAAVDVFSDVIYNNTTQNQQKIKSTTPLNLIISQQTNNNIFFDDCQDLKRSLSAMQNFEAAEMKFEFNMIISKNETTIDNINSDTISELESTNVEDSIKNSLIQQRDEIQSNMEAKIRSKAQDKSSKKRKIIRPKVTKKRLQEQIEKLGIQNIVKHISEKYKDAVMDHSGKFKGLRKDLAYKITDRSDVLFKTIIREIRKVYLKQFQSMSQYLRMQRYREPTYYLVALQPLTDQIINESPQCEQYSISKIYNLQQELKFFLGSMFYPKKVKKIFTNDQFMQKLADNINLSLYQFTLSKLHFLNNWDAFKILMNHFLHNYKEDSLISNKTMSSQKEDYLKGLDFFAKLHGESTEEDVKIKI